jgi:D-alanyl-D-alanine carboxypeptidase
MAGQLQRRLRFARPALVLAVASLLVASAAGAATTSSPSPDARLDAALQAIVDRNDGPPGISVVVQRDATPVLHTAGVADTATKAPIGLDDAMRLASTAKAFSGATATSLVAKGSLYI